MINNKNEVKHLPGKFKNHYVFKLTPEGQIMDSNKIYCVHCSKQFSFRGSTTSLGYHLQKKHPLKYITTSDNKCQKESLTNPITDYLEYQSKNPVSTKVSEQLKYSIAQWIASSGRPISIVTDDGLLQILRIALQNNNYNLPSRRTIDMLINQMYTDKLTENMKSLENIKSIALTTDFWTSTQNESYCGITGHWIDSNWKLKSLCLGCKLVDERHTANNIANYYKEFSEMWNISDKICCIITDNARNMVAGIGKTNYTHIPCIAHCIQRSILAGLNASDSSFLISKCRNLVGHFKHSASNTSELKSSYSDKSQMFHKLQQNMPTRWNSTYLMFLRLLEAKDAIMQYHIDYPKNYNGSKLTESDWEKIGKFNAVLGLLADATKYIGSEKYVTCSAILPLEAFLRRLLTVTDDDPGYIARFKIAALNDFTIRVEGINGMLTLQMAMALDPRYKKLKCQIKEQRNATWEKLSNVFDCFYSIEYPKECRRKIEKGHNDSKSQASKKQKLTLLLSDSDITSDEELDFVNESKVELARYQEEPIIPETEDPLMWWKMNENRYPILSIFVKTILCVPATSVPCERLFSSSGYVVNKMRSSLLPENVNVLVCLRDWLNSQ